MQQLKQGRAVQFRRGVTWFTYENNHSLPVFLVILINKIFANSQQRLHVGKGLTQWKILKNTSR